MSTISDLEHLELVARRIAESGTDLTSDYKHWIDVTFACASLGEGARESYHLICSQYSGYKREECDEKFDNCLDKGDGRISIGTLMKLAADAGIDIGKPRGRRSKSASQKQEEREDAITQAIGVLNSLARWWYNVWSGRVEIQEPDQERRPVSDRDLSTYYIKLKKAGIRISAKDTEHLIKSRDFAPDDNPFQNFFDALPAWHEGDPDYIREFLTDHMVFGDPENTAFYDTMLHKFFIGMVGLWLERLNENPIVPVLYGVQHIGKTHLVRHILPPELQSYLFPVNPSARVDKDFEIAMSETPIMFLDEFNVNNLSKSEAYKYAATSSKSYLRDSYGHFREMRNRRASLIGATNHEKFIREAEGNRRWLAINLKGTVNLNEHPLPYQGAYAQALYLLEHGFETKPTKEQSQLISQHNEPYLMTDDTTEALRTFVRKPTSTDNPEAYSAGDLLKELGVRGYHGHQYNTVNIGRAMMNMDFEPRKVRGTYKYDVVIADFERQKRERIEDAADTVEIY